MTTPSIAEASGRTGFQLTARESSGGSNRGKVGGPWQLPAGQVLSKAHCQGDLSSPPYTPPDPLFTAGVPTGLLVLVLPLTLCGALYKGPPLSGPQFPQM